MDDLSTLLEVIGQFYDSILDESKWHKALQSLSSFVGGTGVFHVIADPGTSTISHSECIGVDPLAHQQYLEYYWAKDVRLAPALPLGVGQPLTEAGLLDVRRFERTEIYGGLLVPFDVPHMMAAWLQKRADAVQALVLENSRAHGPFQKAALERYSLVMPHLIRAARTRELLSSVRQSRDACLTAMDALPLGVIFLDEVGRTIEATAPARRLLKSTDGLTQMHGHVRALSRDEDHRLQQAVHRALSAGMRRDAVGDTVVVRRPDNRKPLCLTVIPVCSPEVLTTIRPAAALMLIVDPEQQPQPRVALIQDSLRLTRAEAVLANTLLTGSSLREAAEALGKSVNTCKSQLRSIYSKTGSRSQAELIRVLVMATLVRG